MLDKRPRQYADECLTAMREYMQESVPKEHRATVTIYLSQTLNQAANAARKGLETKERIGQAIEKHYEQAANKTAE